MQPSPGNEVARLPFILEASILVIPLAPVVSVLYQTAARENENVDCAAKTASPHGHGKILYSKRPIDKVRAA